MFTPSWRQHKATLFVYCVKEKYKNIITVSCMILKEQCVVRIPNNQIPVSIIITLQVLGMRGPHTYLMGNHTKPASPVLHCRNLCMHWAPLHQSSEISQGYSHAQKRIKQSKFNFHSQLGERDAKKSTINSQATKNHLPCCSEAVVGEQDRQTYMYMYVK